MKSNAIIPFTFHLGFVFRGIGGVSNIRGTGRGYPMLAAESSTKIGVVNNYQYHIHGQNMLAIGMPMAKVDPD